MNKTFNILTNFSEDILSYLIRYGLPRNVGEVDELKNCSVTYSETYQPFCSMLFESCLRNRLSISQAASLLGSITKEKFYEDTEKLLIDLPDIKTVLHALLKAIIEDFLLDVINLEEKIQTYVFTASNELENIDQWFCLVWEIDGFYMEGDVFEFSDNILKLKFLKVTAETVTDRFKNIYSREFTALGKANADKMPFTRVEIWLKSGYDHYSKISDLGYYLFEIIPLFKNCCLRQISCERKGHAFRQPNMPSQTGVVSSLPMTLYVRDCEKFSNFLKRFFFKEGAVVLTQSVVPRYILVGYTRYLEALKDYQNFEKSISHSVMALEALFTHAGDNLSYKLIQRIGKIFYSVDKKNIDVQKLVKLSYELRSKYVHGDENGKFINKVEALPLTLVDFQKSITSITRVSLNLFILLRPVKDIFIKNIDIVMITGNEAIKIEQIPDLEKCCNLDVI